VHRGRPNFCMLQLSAIALVALATAGCAALKATQQPGKKDLNVLSEGMPRTHVIAELGAPIWSDERDGDIVDVFAFKQGYTKTVKAGRALVHGAADVATFGLWEVVGIPAEMLADGTEIRVEVHYEPGQRVRSVEVIKGDKAFQPPKLAGWWQRRKAAKTKPLAADEEPDESIADESEIVAGDAPLKR
jgi:outer membrane protein assembly factor BamE (lipoprotein component of BamABCDE complex)